MIYRIERLRQYSVSHKPLPDGHYHVFEQSGDGFLVTGYGDGSDWLVSPLGRQTYGGILHQRPDRAWAIAADRRDYHRMHLYILDLPAKSFRQVTALPLTRDFRIIDYDARHLVLLCPPATEPKSNAREIVLIDIGTTQVTGRFVMKGLTHLFSGEIGRTPDGWVVINASRLGENNERLYVPGIARIHPLTGETTFEIFPRENRGLFRISPSGQYMLKASESVPQVAPSAGRQSPATNLYERSIEVWAGNPLSHIRNLALKWTDTDEPWEIPLPVLVRVIWQPDETAFWWVDIRSAICVGMDGRTSPPIRFDTNRFFTFSALPERLAEATGEREAIFETIRLNGSPSDDLSPIDAPAPAIISPSAADMKRQKAAQTALKKIASEKRELRFTLETSGEQDVVSAIDAVTAALGKGLAWFADGEGIIRATFKINGAAYNERRFFALAEKLGVAVVPALTRLLEVCRSDPDFSHIWCGELEHGRQAFGFAAKALAEIDPNSWIELAQYEMCIDDDHELYFRGEVVPCFVRTHGWREESFAFVLADIVQVRGNMGDDYRPAWRRSGLAAAAEAMYSPASFAELMLRMRDQMLCLATGTFARFAASTLTKPAPVHCWINYDRLFKQLTGDLTAWEAGMFAELERQSGG